MSHILILVVLMVLAAIGFRMGRSRSLALAGGETRVLVSLPGHYGAYVVLWCVLPAFAVFTVWMVFEPSVVRSLVISGLSDAFLSASGKIPGLIYNDIRIVADTGVHTGVDREIAAAAKHYNGLQTISFSGLAVLTLVVGSVGLWVGWRHLAPAFAARQAVERVVYIMLIASSTLAIFTTIGIVLSLLFETVRFFELVPVHDFLFGIDWSPQTAFRADQVGSSGAFGAVPVFAGTLLISVIAISVAGPVGLFSAIYLSEYANRRVHDTVKPVLEILAGIPTVVYGFFAALTVAPLIRETGEGFGIDVASESALAAGVVMGIMIIPFVSSISDDVMTAVPQALRDGSYALGATQSETICKVVLPAALPGIVGGLLLAVSRAIGETMIVVMAGGLAANLTANPFEAVTTVTVQIVTLLVGDQEFGSAKTLVAFALGLVLFVVTLGLNIVALAIVRRYREAYD